MPNNPNDALAMFAHCALMGAITAALVSVWYRATR